MVNLDNLIKPAIPGGQPAFGPGGLGAAYSNPFGETGTQPKTSLFQLQAQPVSAVVETSNHDPWAPITNTSTATNQVSICRANC